MTRRALMQTLVLGLVVGSWPVPLRPEGPPPEPVPLVARKAIPDLDLSDTTFEKAFDRIRALTGANLIVRWPALEAAGVKRDAPVRMRLWDVHPDAALTMLLRYEESGFPATPLAWQEEDGIVTVSTADDLAPGQPQVYDVRDLLAVMARRPKQARPIEGDGRARAEVEDELVRLIYETVLPDSWRDNGGTVGSIRYFSGRLVITQTVEGHRQVRRLLQALRQDFVEKDKPPATSPATSKQDSSSTTIR